MFYTVKLPNETIDNILSIVQNNNLKNTSERTCTIDGFQTDNILNLFSDDILKKYYQLMICINIYFIFIILNTWLEDYN